MNIPKLCHRCGAITRITTSWTSINPGRRFFLCPNCGFDDWMDPPMCPRSVAIIPGLLRRINNAEETARLNGSQATRMMSLLCLSWVFFVLYVVIMGWKSPNHGCIVVILWMEKSIGWQILVMFCYMGCKSVNDGCNATY